MKQKEKSLRPILLNLFNYPIYSYPLFLGLSFGTAYYYGLNAVESAKEKVGSYRFLFIGIFLSAWLGAKVFFLIHSSNDVADDAMNSNFWLGGGFVFYGGLIFSSIFALLYTLLLKRFPYKLLLSILPALPLAHAIGRVGCFLAGCCFGKEWSSLGLHRHPVQLYEAAGNLLIFFYLRRIARSDRVLLTPVIYFLGYSGLRFVLEFFRADLIRGSYFGLLSAAQLTSVFLVLVAGFWAFSIRKKT